MQRLLSTCAVAACVLALSNVSTAGDVRVTVQGTVYSAQANSGAFVGTTTGSTAELRFEVIAQTAPSGSQLNYSIDPSSVSLRVGAITVAGSGAGGTCLFRNNDPAVDGIYTSALPLAGAQPVAFSFSSCTSQLWSSLDITQCLGTYSPTAPVPWCVYDFTVAGPGAYIGIDPTSLTLELPTTGSSYCAGDGSAAPCPCGNASGVGQLAGCLNSLGSGATLRALGSARLGGDSVQLLGAGMPNSSALYFQGTLQQSGGVGVAFGDGLRCVAGTVVRLGTKLNSAGSSQYPVACDLPVATRGGVTTPGTRTYQVWYRNSALYCSASTFNLSNGLELVWAP
jgi:hypothetical protein